MKRWGDLQSDILQDGNLDAAFEEVIGHTEEPARHYKLVEVRGTDERIKKTYVPLPKPTTSRKERVMAKREELLASVKRRIASGTFSIETFKEFWVHEGDKWRLRQSPTIEDRIGINAIVIAETYNGSETVMSLDILLKVLYRDMYVRQAAQSNLLARKTLLAVLSYIA